MDRLWTIALFSGRRPKRAVTTTRREMLAEALDVLNEREKDILTQRRLSDETITLEDLSGQYGVSRERIRQIEVRAFEKLQARMRELAKEKGLMANA
jgi:RNA polymerase sigma-32 factor